MADRLNVRQLLGRHGLRPKKSWSQNFLVDLDVLQQIVDAAGLSDRDAVVELGAGLGALTAMLAREACRVIAVERDRDLARVLRSEFAGDEAVEVLEANAAKLDWPALVDRLGCKPVVVGNLPYHMASQILFRLLEAGPLLSRWLLMVQREMARRMTAAPGGRDYGVLSVELQMHADVEAVLDVGPEAFLPAPRVHSRVVMCRPLEGPRIAVQDPALFSRLVKGVFAQRRKKIRNSFRAAFGAEADPKTLDEVLARAGVSPDQRPEQLGLESLARLADGLFERLGRKKAR